MLIAAALVFGLLIGSFLNVVIWRVPRGESLSHPGSHCPNCDHAIRPHDNVPLVSWLVLRGRCRDCAATISVRYPLVELATGVAFAGTAAWLGLTVLLLPMWWFAAVSIALALIDIDVKRLPNAIVLTSWGVIGLGLVATAAVEGTWGAMTRAAIGAVVMGGAYVLLVVIYPAGMGMGDVKLAVLLGMVLGWFGWAQLIVGFFLGFLLGALWGVGLMVTKRGGRKTAVPFGPFMIAGAWLALWCAPAIATWYGGLLATG